MLNRLKDVFKSFEQCNVRYVVIGGIAAMLHGVPRATFDLDILTSLFYHGKISLKAKKLQDEKWIWKM